MASVLSLKRAQWCNVSYHRIIPCWIHGYSTVTNKHFKLQTSVLHEILQGNWKSPVATTVSGSHELSGQNNLRLKRHVWVQELPQHVWPHLRQSAPPGEWLSLTEHWLFFCNFFWKVTWIRMNVIILGRPETLGRAFAKLGKCRRKAQSWPNASTHRRILHGKQTSARNIS